MIRKKIAFLSKMTSIMSGLHITHNMSFVRAVEQPQSEPQVYDIAVIGGGSGGLAAAFEAEKYGLKVVVIDFVDPTIHGTKWGIGGTCVNVGCIPKKLMHISAGFSESIINANDYGWTLPNEANSRQNQHNLYKYFSWDKLRGAVVNYVKSINFGYIKTIRGLQGVTYKNAMASFFDKETLVCSKDSQVIFNYVKSDILPQLSQKKHQFIRAKNFIIATGTRPTYPKIEGAHLGISSDDIFFLKNAPGRTLVVGGGYIGVEMAGILKSLGFPVTLMTRGKYLRSFDSDMVKQVMNDLLKRGVNIIPTTLPTKLQRTQQGIKATLKCQETGNQSEALFDTVLFATGRHATTDVLNLQKAGVKTASNKQILTLSGQKEKTNNQNIYAIGDVVNGFPQLTPVASKVGASVARRIAHRMNIKSFDQNRLSVNLQNFPTTIFTPLEFSTCGLSEQAAIQKFKEQNIEVYHMKFLPLQQEILQKYSQTGQSLKNSSYMKVVTRKQENSRQKVVGMHYTGPNAGQVMQGFSVAMSLGIYKDQLDRSIGIHPTLAQNFTDLEITKSSGKSFEKTSC